MCYNVFVGGVWEMYMIVGVVREMHKFLKEQRAACTLQGKPQGKQGKWPKKIPVRENTGNSV